MNMAVATPQSDDAEIESKIQKLGLTAPRVTKEQIDRRMENCVIKFHNFPGTTVTIAAVFSAEGFFLASAESASVSLENFNAQLGCEIAARKAMTRAQDKMWELEGYILHRVVHNETKNPA